MSEEIKSKILDKDGLLKDGGPVVMIIKANFEPVDGTDRFQPAGFPEVGHVIYDAPRKDNTTEKVCIVDSPASMANHLETVCLRGLNDHALHPDLQGLPYAVCKTDRDLNIDDKGEIRLDRNDPRDKIVFTTFTEGHRLASDYFLDGLVEPPRWVEEKVEEKKVKSKAKGSAERKESTTTAGHWDGEKFRQTLRKGFEVVEVQKDKKYFLHEWWPIYKTIFRCDPNSLVHGILFAKEQIKISRILTAHLEAFGAKRVSRSGVKFDRLGKTTSGQPIFSVDEETAERVSGTFVLDLALLRSYGRDGNGLKDDEKRLILELALWKIGRLLGAPFRFRTQCHLKCLSDSITVATDTESDFALPSSDVGNYIQKCAFKNPITSVYYPANLLFKVAKDDGPEGPLAGAETDYANEDSAEEQPE